MKGTELAAGAAKMHLRQLRPHPVALPEAEFSPRQKLLFSVVPRSCARCGAAGGQRLQRGLRGTRRGQEMERQENPAVFKSSSVCGQEHNEELARPAMPQRGGSLARVSRKIPNISPEKRQPGDSWKRVQQGAADGWDVTAVPPPKRLQPGGDGNLG